MQRAIDIKNKLKILRMLETNSVMVYPLVQIRLEGKMDLDQEMVDFYLAHGCLGRDENGVFLTSAAEDLIDMYLKFGGPAKRPQKD